MSSELVAALVGAVAGGLIALFGGIVQIFMQGWMSDRGEITCNVAAWNLEFKFRKPTGEPAWSFGAWDYKDHSWEEARTLNAKLDFDGYEKSSAYYSSTANFLNTKGTNVAILEYSVEFLKGKRAVAMGMTTLDSPSIERLEGAAVFLPAETVITFRVEGKLADTESIEAALIEADRVEFVARLSTDKTIRVELGRLP